MEFPPFRYRARHSSSSLVIAGHIRSQDRGSMTMTSDEYDDDHGADLQVKTDARPQGVLARAARYNPRMGAAEHKGPDDQLRVTEIYASVQGESTWAGLPCVFIRLAGCHLRCAYCDTDYAFEGGTDMTLEAVVDQCAQWPWSLAEITGGEPLLQPACPHLATVLLERGYTVLVETSGTLPVAALPPAAIKIMDLKCPGSGVSDATDWDNIAALTGRDEVKFVIGDRADYEWSCDVVRRHQLPSRCRAVLFAPVFDVMAPQTLSEWILEDGMHVRLQLPLHKYVWPPGRRGV